MKPFILRRLKKDVLSFLPPKTENIVIFLLSTIFLEYVMHLTCIFVDESTHVRLAKGEIPGPDQRVSKCDGCDQKYNRN